MSKFHILAATFMLLSQNEINYQILCCNTILSPNLIAKKDYCTPKYIVKEGCY